MNTLIPIGTQVAAIAVVGFVAWKQHLEPVSDLGLRWPSPRQMLLWGAVFAALWVFQELVYWKLGLGENRSWTDTYTLPEILVRSLGIVVVAPLAEELLFRGLLFNRLQAAGLGVLPTIVLVAAGFALSHIQYRPAEIALIFVDGLFFGIVRWQTGSVYFTILLHALGNLSAVIERLIVR